MAPTHIASHRMQEMNFDAAAPLLMKLSSPKLHALYAKAKEGRGLFTEAVAAYERAKSWDDVVRIYVGHAMPYSQWHHQPTSTPQTASRLSMTAHHNQNTQPRMRQTYPYQRLPIVPAL